MADTERRNRILEWVKMKLYHRSRSLAMALGILEVAFSEETASVGSDGWTLYLNEAWMTELFERDGEALCAEVLHVLCHCMLGHPFLSSMYDRKLSAATIHDPKNSLLKGKTGQSRVHAVTWRDDPDVEMDVGERDVELPTADLVDVESAAWTLLTDIVGKKYASEFQERLRNVDDHRLWNRKDTEIMTAKARASGHGPGNHPLHSGGELLAQQKRWQRAHAAVQKSGGTGHRAGNREMSVVQSLKLTSEKRYDYRDFLQRFAVLREEGIPDTDQFDYGLYHWGMETYGNSPLMEPLEYRERRKIETLVIVIDTSASCKLELLRMFLEETRNILKEEELFFQRFQLHLIQCDNRIQRDDRITSQEELDRYLAHLEVKGGGGTDYRPAFERIEQLQQTELHRLKAVLYFSDGYGIFPAEMPPYHVAFVFLKYRYDDIDVPEWAEKLVLEAERPQERGAW